MSKERVSEITDSIEFRITDEVLKIGGVEVRKNCVVSCTRCKGCTRCKSCKKCKVQEET